MTQTMLGVMVFITGIFAFLSAAFAINTAFGNVQLAILVGLLWGLMIIWFDRAIVSSANKWAVTIRLPIALIIGLTVSIPLEIKLLEGRLNQFLTEQSQVKNKDVIERRNVQIKSLQDRKKILEDAENKYRDEISKWDSAMEAETVGRVKDGRTGRAGQGPAYREAERNKQSNEKLLKDTTADLNKLREEEAGKKLEIESELNNTKFGYINADYTFLSQFEALEGLKEQSDAAYELSWLLRFLFIFVEIFPALLKLFLPYSSYDALLESHRRESVQLVHSIANERMTRMAGHPSAVHGSLLNAVSAAAGGGPSGYQTNGSQSGHQTAKPYK